MKRREFITLLGGAVAWPLALSAQDQQQRKVFRILWVSVDSNATRLSSAFGDGLLGELRRSDYVEERNLTLWPYFDDGRPERYAELAQDIGNLKPDVILANTARQLNALKAANITVPIVGNVIDPVAQGFAISMARPGGNITGVSIDAGRDVWGKRLQLLKEAVPLATRVSYIIPRYIWDGPNTAQVKGFAQRIGFSLVGPPVEHPYREAEYQSVFAAMAKDGVDALFVNEGPENFSNRRLIVDLARSARLPTMYPFREFTQLGGLMSYGVDWAELGRHAGRQIAQIFKGENPGNIPFYQATKFELVINLTTAKALGLDVPPMLLARADEVIE